MYADVTIAEKSLGTRPILNTNFGIDAAVKRCSPAWGTKPVWQVTITCNGTADYNAFFRPAVKRWTTSTLSSPADPAPSPPHGDGPGSGPHRHR